METSPLTPDILFHLGPVPISRAVVTTWAIMAAMMLFLSVALRRPAVNPGPLQAALEIVVTEIDGHRVDEVRLSIAAPARTPEEELE